MVVATLSTIAIIGIKGIFSQIFDIELSQLSSSIRGVNSANQTAEVNMFAHNKRQIIATRCPDTILLPIFSAFIGYILGKVAVISPNKVPINK